MKVFTKIVFSVLILFNVSLVSCNEDDEETPVVINPTFFTAKVGGNPFESVVEDAKGMLHVGEEGVLLLSISGTNENGDIVDVNVADFWGIGTFEISDDPFPNYLGIGSYYKGGVIWGNSSFSEELKGELIVTEYETNGRIEGTFRFYIQHIFTEEIIQVTEGAFNIPIYTFIAP